MCLVVISGKAQIYPGDSYVKLPTREIYDTDLMEMNLWLMERTTEQRKELFYRYANMAIEAFNSDDWSYAIYFTDKALETHYYNCDLYYVRGYSNERLGNTRQAKRDYKQGVDYGSKMAAKALEELQRRE